MIKYETARFETSFGRPDQLTASDMPEIAFAGKSNVGKSSLLNRVLNRKGIARVSSTPGKTVTVNFYDVDGKLFLVDLPGYGFAKRPPAEKAAWSALTDGYFTNNPNIDAVRLVCQLIDSRIGPTEDDWNMLEYLTESRMNFFVVGTKCDKLNRSERDKFASLMAEEMEAQVVMTLRALGFGSIEQFEGFIFTLLSRVELTSGEQEEMYDAIVSNPAKMSALPFSVSQEKVKNMIESIVVK